MAEHDDFDGEVRVVPAGEPHQLEDAAERPIQEREGAHLMLAASGGHSQSTQASDGIVGTHKSRQPPTDEVDLTRLRRNDIPGGLIHEYRLVA